MQPLIIHDETYQVAFIVAAGIFGLVGLSALLGSLRLSARDAGAQRDRGSWLTVQVGVLAGVLLAYWAATRLTQATMTWHRPVVFGAGIALMLIGSAVNWVAIRQLGPFFTVQVAVQSEQRVVRTGLYRFVRHPAYGGQLLFFLGFGLTLTNWLSIPAVLLCSLAGYGYRIAVEERALREELDGAYDDYALRTRRLIPHLW